MKKRYLLLPFLLLITTLASGQNKASDDAIPGEVIVQLAPGGTASSFIRQLAGDHRIELVLDRVLGPRSRALLFTFDPDRYDGDLILAQLRRHPMVLAAQLSYRVSERSIPDDAFFSQQWGLDAIDAPLAWDRTTGGQTSNGDTIVLAIIDSSFDPDHEDLIDNRWYNRGEVPGDGIDNDGNGFTDDIYGYDFVEDSPDVMTTTAHGTSVAGLAGARGNNGAGVTGVNWNVKLILLRAVTVPEIIEAYEYVIDLRTRYNQSGGSEGAFVVATNASWGKSRTFCEEQPVWGGMYDLLGAAGILTGAATDNAAYDVEELGDMPANCPSEYLIVTLNTEEDDEKYQGSAWGRISIDLGAPGQGSFTTRPSDTYGLFGGNSAAAPHLTGAIGLLYSLPCPRLADRALTEPAATALIVREALLAGVDRVAALEEYTVTGGRLNVNNSLDILASYCTNAPGDLALINLYPNPAQTDLTVEYETPESGAYRLEWYNTLGQLVRFDELQVSLFNRNRIDLDVSGMARGAYILMLRQGEEEVARKVIVY